MEGLMVSSRFHSRRGGGIHSSASTKVRRTPPPQWRPAIGCASASIWRTITPPAGGSVVPSLPRTLPSGDEGSWNAAWDVRPARWLHGLDSAWLLFGVRSSVADRPDESTSSASEKEAEAALEGDQYATDVAEEEEVESAVSLDSLPLEEHYKVTGVLADGRCLFRAIIYGSYISCGREAPDESGQREFADQLRYQVAQELLKRREEMEWSVEGDFDAYVQDIQRPWTWGGETELLMASHVLQSPISVFMIDKGSGDLLNIANYGHDYAKEGANSIKVLFHGYGHYEALEVFNHQSDDKAR